MIEKFFSDPNGMKLKIKTRRKLEKSQIMGILKL
jgi:hypothetical protein